MVVQVKIQELLEDILADELPDLLLGWPVRAFVHRAHKVAIPALLNNERLEVILKTVVAERVLALLQLSDFNARVVLLPHVANLALKAWSRNRILDVTLEQGPPHILHLNLHIL